ncbi:MAG: leucine-rich repeat domain-containing protein [Saprospiraceae bacterium]
MQATEHYIERLKENLKNKSTFLDIGNCGLSSLPKEIMSLEWLEEINLGTIYWHDEEGTFKESQNNGPLNQLYSEDFAVLQPLKNLKKITLRSCAVRNLEALSQLSQLESLSIGGNDLIDIEALKKMTNLKVLSLYDNGVQDIEALNPLTRLEILSLNYNKIGSIAPVANMPLLRELHLAGNLIQDLSPLAGLSKLEKINLNNNKVQQIRLLSELPSLRALSLDRNPVNDCPPEIAFSGNINRIRTFFKSLQKSQEESKIQQEQTGVAPKQEEEVLEVKIILVGNATSGKTSLSKILRGIAFNAQENTTHGINIDEWEIPASEIGASMRVNIWDFGGQEYYHGTHQIFLDSNSVYLLLWDKKYNQNGIKNTVVYFDNEKVELPQEHFHYSYWLDNIRFHATGTTGVETPPVILVQNKIDMDGGRPEVLDFTDLKDYNIELLTGISAMFARSNKREMRRFKYGFEIFKEDLLHILKEKAQQNTGTTQLPDSWVQIRTMVRQLRSGTNVPKSNVLKPFVKDNAWIDFADFTKACRKVSNNLSDEEIETLAYSLNKIGAVVWLPEIDRKVYIDPSWLTEKMYRVLNEQVRKKNGYFTDQDVEKVIANPKESQLIINLMREWEIIFSLGEEKTHWVAPQYLPDDHPMENLFKIALTGLQDQFYMIKAPLFHYRKMLRRLIFLYGNDQNIQNKEFWKNGILFVTKENKLRIFLKGIQEPDEPDHGRLMICVEKNKPETDYWWGKIFSDLLLIFMDKAHLQTQNVSDSWHGLGSSIRNKNSTHNSLQISLDGNDFIPLAEILQSANGGVSAIMSPGRKRYRMQEFSPLLMALQITPPQPTIFFSYSHDDKDMREALDKHLAPLKRTGSAISWFDGEIQPGQNWEESIRKNLKSADVILLLISHNFINSDFIWENELSPALERHERGECRVIPVLLSPCFWEELPLARLQMTPQAQDTGRLQPISLWRDQNEAYTMVAKAILHALKELNIG